ncbi:MAG: Crp/Fnr family transcriptional regulator [Halioglobus sp.]|nr:Crp/Fnr family transcriptional regulator [Halioglobus sp.]|tara:strand:+ start:1260 stop:2039 length:780 start_codon:yes stop_codon:yes gene_type:complete
MVTLDDADFPASTDTDLICSSALDVECLGCKLRLLCLPAGLTADEVGKLEASVEQSVSIAAGESLYEAGDAFTSLYAVLRGGIKKYRLAPDGEIDITGFHLPGEIFGYSGIDSGHYLEHALAFADSVVCEIPFEDIEALSRDIPNLQRRLLHLMSQRIVEDHELMCQLVDQTPSRKRICAFLLGLSSRAARRGESSTRIEIPVTLVDIGNYLGVRPETVSRLLTQLAAEGAIRRDKRSVTILDMEKLRKPVCGAGAGTG